MGKDRGSRSGGHSGDVTLRGDGNEMSINPSTRRRLYQILSDPTQPNDAKITDLLRLGCERLGMENGHVVRIDTETRRHEIEAVAGSALVEADVVSDLDRTFCRKTLEEDQLLAVQDATTDEWADDPAAQAWNINCYVGSKLYVQTDVFGTLCFVDRSARSQPFDTAALAFVDLLSQAISRLKERQVHETALESQQERFEIFVREIADYALFMLDPAGHVKSWNSGATNLLQYEEDELLESHLSRLFPEAECARGAPARLLEEARQQGRIEDEGWRVRKDGTTFWALETITALYDDGELRGFGTVVRDLTERREAEQALQEQQAFTERALDSLDDLFIVLSPEGEMVQVNERALEVTGYTEAEALSMHPIEFFAPEDQATIAAGISEVLESGQSTVQGTLVTNDDERLQYEFRVRTLTDSDGTVTAIVGIGRDITQRKLYEQRLEVAQRVLRHNLRNEMNVIRGLAENLSTGESTLTERAAEQIIETADRLLERSEKTRMMTELDASELRSEPVDVFEVLPALLDEFRREAPEATIETDLPESEPLRLPVGDRFETAVGNAVENAIQHNSAPEPWVRVEVARDAGQVHVRILDDGPGIPSNEREVLERETETQLTHGRGLGLWLIHWCMATIGGQISFADRDPTGSELTLTFPIVETA